MKRYLRILQSVDVYARHDLLAKSITRLEPGQLIPFNREKRRGGTNWMEIYREGNKLGYIKKEKGKFYKCENATLDDEIAYGFNFTYKTDTQPPVNMLFFPEGSINKKANVGKIEVKSVENTAENKMMYIMLEYPTDLIDVEPIKIRKGQQFYVINKPDEVQSIFIEIDNLNGTKGFLLNKTKYTNKADKWVTPVAVTVAILTVLVIFLAFLASGWIVISGLMILVGFIAAAVAIIIIQIVLMILKGIFIQIYKRL